MIYTQQDSEILTLDNSYETLTQDLSTETTTFTNIDNQNSFGTLLDNSLVVLEQMPIDSINELPYDLASPIEDNTNVNLSCPTGYILENGICIKQVDNNKMWLKWVLIIVGLILAFYMYKKYVAN